MAEAAAVPSRHGRSRSCRVSEGARGWAARSSDGGGQRRWSGGGTKVRPPRRDVPLLRQLSSAHERARRPTRCGSAGKCVQHARRHVSPCPACSGQLARSQAPTPGRLAPRMCSEVSPALTPRSMHSIAASAASSALRALRLRPAGLSAAAAAGARRRRFLHESAPTARSSPLMAA